MYFTKNEKIYRITPIGRLFMLIMLLAFLNPNIEALKLLIIVTGWIALTAFTRIDGYEFRTQKK